MAFGHSTHDRRHMFACRLHRHTQPSRAHMTRSPKSLALAQPASLLAALLPPAYTGARGWRPHNVVPGGAACEVGTERDIPTPPAVGLVCEAPRGALPPGCVPVAAPLGHHIPLEKLAGAALAGVPHLLLLRRPGAATARLGGDCFCWLLLRRRLLWVRVTWCGSSRLWCTVCSVVAPRAPC